MVGKNNKFLKENKNNQRFLRFSLRKLSVGVVSVAIAAGFYIGGSQSVLADTPSTVPVVNLQNSSASADSAADSTAAEAGNSAVPAAEQQNTATFNVAEVKPVAASNPANLLDNKAQSSAAPDSSAKPSDDDLLKNIKTYDPDNATFNKYQTLVNTYKKETTDTSSQYVFSVINDDRIDTDFIWTIDRNTGSKVSVYLADRHSRSWDKQEEITSYHHFASEGGNFNVTSILSKDVILNYTPKNSSASIDVVDPNGQYLKTIYELSDTDDNFYSSITEIVPAKSQPVIKFLYKDPSTGKLLDLRKPIYDLNGLTGKRFVLDTSSKAYDYYKSKDKEAFDGFDFVGVIGNQQGTFTQFAQGKTYVKHYADNDLEITYHQIDAEGTMHISYSSNGKQYTPVITKDGKVYSFKDGEQYFINGELYYTEDGSLYLIDEDGEQHLIEDNKHALEAYSLEAGHSLRASDTLMIFNPFVAGDYAYEFIYVPHSELHQTITRTITVHEPGKDANTITQTAKIFRDATVDQVTGEVTYGAWSTDSTNWKAVAVPSHDGYTTVQSDDQSGIPAVTVKDGQKNVTIDVTYTANVQTGKIFYVDGDDSSNVVSHTDLTGKTGDHIKVNPQAPADWKIVEGQDIPTDVVAGPNGIPTVTVKVEHDTITVTPDQPKNPSDKLPDGKNYPSGVTKDDLNKTVTRTINITKPGEATKTTKQTTSFKRSATVDLVNHKVTYTDWAQSGNNGWVAVDVPTVDGYTPNVTSIKGVNVTPDTKDTTIDVTYTAKDQTTHINYVDPQGNTVKRDTVSGKTDQTVKTNSAVPDGWKIINGQVPETIHFTGEETPDTTITIDHATTSIDHNRPVKPGDKTPSGKVIDGAHDKDLNQTITRTINVKTPDGQTTTTTQVAKIFRDATIDDVTGEVTYGSWSEDTWADFKPGQIAGYTASPADVPAVTVKDGQQDQTVNITYTANEGTVQIKYVDRDGNEIGRQVITGHVGDTVKVTPQIPEDWVPVDPDTVPTEVQIKEENGQIIIVVIRHGEKDPVQTKNITRTIKVTTPDGQTKTIKQVATISRTGELDLVTGQITWQPWTTAQWDTFKPATIAGYTPSLAEVPAVTVDGETTDQMVIITYTPVVTPTQPDSQAPNQKADSNAQPAVTVVTSQQTATVQQAESTTNSRRLPQTGNSHDASALAGLGLASLMGLFGLGGKRRKRD